MPRKPSPLSPSPATLQLDNQVCFALYSASLAMTKLYKPLLDAIGLTYPQYLVMLVLWERDERNVSDICNQLYLETATLTPLLKRLEARGLVNRRRSPSDERQVIVSLSEAGRALYAQVQHIPGCMSEALSCSQDDIVALRKQLLTLRDALFQHV